MIENLNDYLVGIALGVRFRPNFSIEDKLGEITDSILYSEDSLFSSKVFPEVGSNFGLRTLMNKDTDNKLHIDNSNIVLEISFKDNQGFVKNDADDILEAFKRQIINDVLRQHNIQEIVRVGYIQRYLFTIDGLAKSFIDRTLGQTLEGINDISLKFSKRIPLPRSLAKEDVNDYDNSIYTVNKKSNEQYISIAIDYQSFFDPFLQRSDLINYQQFIQRATDFYKNNFLTWLNSYYAEVLLEQTV